MGGLGSGRKKGSGGKSKGGGKSAATLSREHFAKSQAIKAALGMKKGSAVKMSIAYLKAQRMP